MTDLRALLAPIRARHEASAPLCKNTCPSEECQAMQDRARLLAAIEAVTELAEAWQARGEHLRKSAESAPEDVQESLDDQGGDMIWHAGLIRTAIAAALGSDTTNQEGTQ